MLDLYDKMWESVQFIQEKWGKKPDVGIILGSGLGPLVERIQIDVSIEYGEIPHFLKSTATSHRGRTGVRQLCG